MDRVTNCGIYKITSPKGRIYIGQAVDLKRRFKEYEKFNDRIKTNKSNEKN